MISAARSGEARAVDDLARALRAPGEIVDVTRHEIVESLMQQLTPPSARARSDRPRR